MLSDTKSNFDLSLIVPVYSNAATLEKLYQRVHQVLNDEDISFELLFVNDAGPDESLNILCDMHARYAEVSLVNMQHNVGQHEAVLHGLRYARGECCVVMDADMQDPPEALAPLWRARSSRCKAIFAGRRGNYQNFTRMLSSRIYKTLLSFLAGLPRDAGIFVLMEREMVQALLAMPVKLPWINVMIGLSSLPMSVVPVKRDCREQGVSAYSSWGRLLSALRGIYCALSYRIWPAEKSYLEGLEQDPVAWFKSAQF